MQNNLKEIENVVSSKAESGTDDVRNLKHLVDYHDGLYFEASKIEAYTFDMTGWLDMKWS